MKIALGTSSLRGNRNDDDLLLVLPSVPNNSSNIYRNCLNIYQTLTSEHYKYQGAVRTNVNPRHHGPSPI